MKELRDGFGPATIGNTLVGTSSASQVVNYMLEIQIKPMREESRGTSNIPLHLNDGSLSNIGQIVLISSFVVADSADIQPMLNDVLSPSVFPLEKFQLSEMGQNFLAVIGDGLGLVDGVFGRQKGSTGNLELVPYEFSTKSPDI